MGKINDCNDRWFVKQIIDTIQSFSLIRMVAFTRFRANRSR